MDNKLRQIMAAKKTPKTEADKAGMNDLLAKLRLKRDQATGGNESFTLLVQTELRDEEEQRTAQE